MLKGYGQHAAELEQNGAKKKKKKKAKRNSAALYGKLITSCLNGKERESYARRKDSAHQSVAHF